MRKALIPVQASDPAATPPARGVQRDLWLLLDALALCRKRYDLTANSLSVLRALISFLPKTATHDDPLIVWPSNRALCERADGMDERTLRRHLERLVAARLIERRSSSNGKRFALRCRKAVVTAFGFDLAPLLDAAGDLHEAAQEQRETTERCTALRVEVLHLLHGLSSLTLEEDLEIRRELRRRPEPVRLAAIRDDLAARSLAQSDISDVLTASDRQIDRHQQKTEEDSCDSVCDLTSQPLHRESLQAEKEEGGANEDVSLHDCLAATSESRAFAQEPIRNWDDIIRLADTLAPMIGIGRELADHAKRSMGPLQSAISILCILQRSDHIQRPAAYLRRLSVLAEGGQYSLKSLVRSAMRNTFAAVNSTHA